MDSVLLISGLVLIVVGWLCYRFPNMINPYGSMTPERKALVDIDGLKRSLFIIWAITGALLIVTAALSYKKIMDEAISGYVLTGLLLASLIPTFMVMKKYNGFGRDTSGRAAPIFTKPTKWVWVSMGLTAVFVVAIFVFSNKAPQIEVSEEKVSISGMYGRDIPTADIVTVELLEKLPSIQMRTNGSSTHKYAKGHFLLKNGEKCIMIVRLNAPYIEIRTTDNLYYINGATKEETMNIFEQLNTVKP